MKPPHPLRKMYLAMSNIPSYATSPTRPRSQRRLKLRHRKQPPHPVEVVGVSTPIDSYLFHNRME